METSGNRTALGVSADIAQQVGARLRRARETIGRSTSTLSAKIKIREHYLVAIEEGTWNELPPGLNGRGLIRIYARELSVAVPELDQAANQTVMPAEHDAQAPYQINAQRKDVHAERDIPVVRVSMEQGTVAGGQRPAEQTLRTNTLTSSARNIRTREATPLPSVRPVPQPTHGHRIIESSPDEEPLDVVTPDVASILGINLDTIEERPAVQQLKKTGKGNDPKGETFARQSAPTLVIPETDDDLGDVEKASGSKQKVTQKISQPVAPVQVVAEQTKEPVPTSATASATIQETEVVPSAAPAAQVVENRAKINPSIDVAEVSVASSAAVDASPVASIGEMSAVETTQEARNTATEQAVETSTTEASAGVSAAELYLKKQSTDAAEASSEAESSTQSSGSRGLRIAIGLVAACVAVLVVGRMLTREAPTEVASESAPTSAQPAADGSETNQKAEQKTEQKTQADAPVPPATGIVEAKTATTGAQDATTTSDATVASPAESSATAGSDSDAETSAQKNPVAAAETSAQAAAPDATQTTSRTAGTGATLAVLTLLEPIEIQVTADGQRVYSGRHEAGKVDIKFSKRAEIFVQDGSKAKLKYSGWEHGALGQPGRKRRIVLNAEAFASGTP